MWSEGVWLNPPSDWRLEDGVLHVVSEAKTDFWRDTYYGFIRDNGHFFGLPAPAAFTATLRFEADYSALYDQAGLMVRIDAETWLKMGIEHSDGVTNFSIVVTRGKSDWSVIAHPLVSGPQTIRLTRNEGAVIAHFQTGQKDWRLMRVADFPDAAARIGPMICTPERAGLTARFSDLIITEPIAKALHE